MKSGQLLHGGAISIDGVHLKVHGNHYYDFTHHYLEINKNGLFENAEFAMRNKTLFLVESPDSPTAKNIRDWLNRALLEKYELTLDHFFRGFTVVTDGAAVMAVSQAGYTDRTVRCTDPDRIAQITIWMAYGSEIRVHT